ncbi:MAG: DMT family transporter [Myxococcota bacterium]
MSNETVGALFALGAALTWAVAVILFKRSGESMSPWTLNMQKSLVALLCFMASLPFVDEVATFTGREFAVLLLSGVLGISLADTLFFVSLNALGASRAAVVECLYTPFVVIIAFIYLGETLSLYDALGALLIFGGLLMSVESKDDMKLPGPVWWRGVAYGALAIAVMAASIVFIKPILERHNAMLSTTVRALGGVVGLLGAGLVLPHTRRHLWLGFGPQAGWRYAVPGAVLGTYLALFFMGVRIQVRQGRNSRLAQSNQYAAYGVTCGDVFTRGPDTPPMCGSIDGLWWQRTGVTLGIPRGCVR